MIFKEIEFKYSAAKVQIEDFNSFCKSIQGHESYRLNHGIDTFFTDPNRQGSFFRLREDTGTYCLTYKRKIQADNTVRVEYNLDLMNGKNAAYALVEELGYKYDAAINKVNYVHLFPWYVLSYYICYDANMQELGRFIEIEMREDYNWTSEQQMLTELKVIEKVFKPLGISAEGRIKESLYEMYRSKSS